MHEEAGAPEGFTDCIGWLMQDDGPSRWNVTFTVDDTDASAARAAELGGEILVEPYDAGPVRVAQIKDPQGADVHDQLVRPESLGRQRDARGARPARAAGAGCHCVSSAARRSLAPSSTSAS